MRTKTATPKRRPMKAQLNDLTEAFYLGIYNLTPRQRSAAIRALQGLTATNCSWLLHRFRPLLLGLIDDASGRRERNARERSRARRANWGTP